MRIQLQCVVQDGSAPASSLSKQKLPTEQRIDVPRGERLEVQLVCVRQDGTPFDLENCNLMLTVRRKLADAEPMFARLAALGDPPDVGLATIEVAGTDTLGLIEKTSYIYDVQLTDSDDERWQVVPAAYFYIKPIVGLAGEIPEDPLVDPNAPIAIGPRGYSVLASEGPPDPDLGRNFDWVIDRTDPQATLSRKEDDAWTEVLELRGPPGPAAIPSDDPPQPLGVADPGDSDELSRSNHVHPHGNQVGGSLHALAVVGVSHGFMSSTMATQLASLVAADFGGQIAGLAVDVAGLTGDLASLSTAVSSLSTTVAGLTGGLASLTTTVDDLTGDVSSLSTTVAGLTGDLSSLSTTVAGIAANYVPKTRLINTTGPLAGGGALTGDLTLSIGAADALNAGSLSAADFTKLAGLAALTTKGDLLGFTTVPVRVAVGTDDYVVTADSTAAAGWSWKAVPPSGADAAGTYLVQTATNKPLNAQVMAALATGMLSVTTTTGIVASTAFADNTIPLGSGAKLVSSTLTLASNYLDHAVSSSGGTVKRSVRNTSNTASAKAWDLIEVAGSTADDPYTQYSISGTANFVVGIDNSDSDNFKVLAATTLDTTSGGIRMNSSGNVTIGTFAPPTTTGARLTIRESDASNPIIISLTNISNGGAQYSLNTANTSLNVKGAQASSSFLGTAASVTTQIDHSVGTGGLRIGTSISADLQLGANNIERLRITAGGNLLVNGAAAPASLVGGFVVANGTAPSADPSNAFAMWSASAAANFRGGDSTITTLATYAASHTASRAGGAVSVTIENTSSAASSSAALTVKVPNASTGSAYIDFERTGGTSWRAAASTSGLAIGRVGVTQILLATATTLEITPSSALGAGRSIVVSWDAAGLPTTGPTLESRSTAAGTYLNIFTYAGNTTGGVAIAARDTVANSFKYAVSVANRAGPPELKLIQHGGVVTVGGATAPASFDGGLVMKTAVAATADTSAGEATLYFDGTDWKTRIGAATKTFTTV